MMKFRPIAIALFAIALPILVSERKYILPIFKIFIRISSPFPSVENKFSVVVKLVLIVRIEVRIGCFWNFNSNMIYIHGG